VIRLKAGEGFKTRYEYFDRIPQEIFEQSISSG